MATPLKLWIRLVQWLWFSYYPITHLRTRKLLHPNFLSSPSNVQPSLRFWYKNGCDRFRLVANKIQSFMKNEFRSSKFHHAHINTLYITNIYKHSSYKLCMTKKKHLNNQSGLCAHGRKKGKVIWSRESIFTFVWMRKLYAYERSFNSTNMTLNKQIQFCSKNYFFISTNITSK